MGKLTCWWRTTEPTGPGRPHAVSTRTRTGTAGIVALNLRVISRRGLTGCVPIGCDCRRGLGRRRVRHVVLSELTNEQWVLLKPVCNAPGKRGPKHAPDLSSVVDAMLCISHTGCQWRFLPESFGPWTRVWSQFRRWSRNGTWARALTVLHEASREADGRGEGPRQWWSSTHAWPAGRPIAEPPSTTPGRAGLHPREPDQ
jgi:transposase